MSTEAGFFAVWACLQGFIVTGVADAGIDTAVISDWFNPCELLGIVSA